MTACVLPQIGRILVINPAYAELMEIPKDKLEGKLISIAYSEFEKTRILESYLNNYKNNTFKSKLETEIIFITES
jgi:PAS domain-containing protein